MMSKWPENPATKARKSDTPDLYFGDNSQGLGGKELSQKESGTNDSDQDLSIHIGNTRKDKKAIRRAMHDNQVEISKEGILSLGLAENESMKDRLRKLGILKD